MHFDYTKDEWGLGYVQQIDGGSPFSIPENAAIVKIDKKYNCEHSNAFILGGCDTMGNLLNWAFGLNFKQVQSYNGALDLGLAMSYSEPSFLLPLGRMMHQACIVENEKGEPLLMLIGGKVGALTT